MVNFNIKFDYTLRREISKTVPPTTSSSELGNILTIGEATVVDPYSRQGDIAANVVYGAKTYVFPFLFVTSAIQASMPNTFADITRDYYPGRGTFIRTVDTTDFMGTRTNPLDNIYGNYPLWPDLDGVHTGGIPIFELDFDAVTGALTGGSLLAYDIATKTWDNVVSSFTAATYDKTDITKCPWLYLQAFLTPPATYGAPYFSRVCYQVFDSAEIAEREALSRKYEVEQFIENYNRIHNNDYSSMEGAYSANSNFQTYTV